ncbi:MobF family relaxase [Granulicella mallensis]|uniref:Conjugative relaxase domain protein n=1 Tax=Granulicella mallensis (strain ATCC BAA-1857 / DSM 23137 / MP5ACTX8) TaxID=682795 RepID=G8NT30_GRAMM|nr:MobF family relaxase [Granulicella mallensis]AEU37460.1 conjugative relaxase domain protein [Granulicella mallensis MP5ACTX8]
MVTLSKPISARQAQTYHKEEFANAKENYYTEGERVRGEWQGHLAERWGMTGEVREQQFARLSEGQHPASGEQLVRHQTTREYQNERGETVRSMEHRAGWDATFSAPKSVSLTALVGGDDRVREAHRESVRTALDEMEKYVQARMGGNVPAQTTGAWAVAKFEHDSSRPVDGYAAPQLHTHAVVFNVTETADGNTRALQPQELYKTQQYATAVYRSELAAHLQGMGYEIERGEHGQPEIKGYSREYLEASSPRRQQIVEHLEALGAAGAGAAQIAAHRTRDAKQPLSHEEVRERHQQMAVEYGQQPQRVLAEAAQRPGVELRPESSQRTAHEGMSYARERGMEREAVADERSLMRDALKHTMGAARLPEIKAEFARRAEERNLIEVDRRAGLAGRAYTTGEMQGYERELIERMKMGQGTHDVLADDNVRQQMMEQHAHLSLSQRQAVDAVLTSRDQMMGLEGVAGAGKTTSLSAVREAAERAGYEIEGLAPTSRAAQKLGEAGIETQTLQRHLARGEQPYGGQKRLYVVDESSMASTIQMHTFVERLKENDRVLFVGDTRQHEAVEAGRPYSQLQDAGLRTAHLDEIIRQKDPALKDVVEHLARGEVREAIGILNEQDRVIEIGDRRERINEIAREYTRSPERTLVVSPDNESRREINSHIHQAMQVNGKVSSDEHRVHVLYTRQDLTGADRQYAQNYERGDVLRYSKGSKPLGIEAGEYARVTATDRESNMVTVARRSGEELSYDPRRLQGVTVYRDSERTFAQGDRVQMTAPYHEQKLANRELGTVERIDGSGNLKLKMDSGRDVEFNARQHPHLDYGYAVTSHSSQGQTADRVLIHVDSSQAHGELLNSRMAYVSVSRAQFDVKMYTNDSKTLAQELSREVTKATALQPESLRQNVLQREADPIGLQLGRGLLNS